MNNAACKADNATAVQAQVTPGWLTTTLTSSTQLLILLAWREGLRTRGLTHEHWICTPPPPSKENKIYLKPKICFQCGLIFKFRQQGYAHNILLLISSINSEWTAAELRATRGARKQEWNWCWFRRASTVIWGYVSKRDPRYAYVPTELLTQD